MLRLSPSPQPREGGGAIVLPSPLAGDGLGVRGRAVCVSPINTSCHFRACTQNTSHHVRTAFRHLVYCSEIS